jgi:uroporphyrinogen decarboxylase
MNVVTKSNPATNADRETTSRTRVQTALRHVEPDRNPVDLLMTPEVWHKLVKHFGWKWSKPGDAEFFDPLWNDVAANLQSDMRLLSYDQFCNPPESVLRPGARIEWWDALSRSTPNRMWRQWMPDGDSYDIWGHHYRIVDNPTGAYEEFATYPLRDALTVDDLKAYPFPDPDWWDWSPLPEAIRQLDPERKLFLRFRIGSVFELAWQIRGMQEFLMDLASQPEIPIYIMERLTEIHVENLKRALATAGDELDMVYFYDDVATARSLMISPTMYRDMVKPCHIKMIEVAKKYNKPIMYHCDGAIAYLIPDLIELGIDLLNPIQPDSPGMECERLKREFGDKISFHGGIDIIKTLPRGTVEDVRNEVKQRVRVLGEKGGYVMCSSHHIQSDTPVENILAMYDPALRYR